CCTPARASFPSSTTRAGWWGCSRAATSCARSRSAGTGIPTIGHRQCLDEAFRILQETSAAAIGVVDAQGRLIGLVTPGTVGEMMMVRDALPGRPGYGPWGRPAGASPLFGLKRGR